MASVNEMINLAAYESGPGKLTGKGGGGGLMDVLAGVMAMEKTKEEEQLKKQKNKMDMYKTLRDSGYDPQTAYKSVTSNELPKEPGGLTDKEKKSEADINRTNAQTEKIKKETEYIPQTKKAAQMKQDILDTIAAGDDLTPGEQKIYDEVIRKYGDKSDLENVLSSKQKPAAAAPVNKDDYVPMINPEGKKKLVPKANVKKAEAKGWKKR